MADHITDEMVEKALDKWFTDPSWRETFATHPCRKFMRAALSAVAHLIRAQAFEEAAATLAAKAAAYAPQNNQEYALGGECEECAAAIRAR